MAHIRRQSSFMSSPGQHSDSPSATLKALLQAHDSDEWIKLWGDVRAVELIDEPLYEIDEDATVEAACEMLLSKNTSCLAITTSKISSKKTKSPYCTGLFDFADVNAFLTLAATQHALTTEELEANPRMKDVVDAAKAGRVPVRLVSNLSDKNPLITLPSTASLLDLLQIFSQGSHRAGIRSSRSPSLRHTPPTSASLSVSIPDSSTSSLISNAVSSPPIRIKGLISDRQVLSWFLAHSSSQPPIPHPTPSSNAPEDSVQESQTPSLEPLLASPLSTLLITTYSPISLPSSELVLDAMRTMSAEGLSSVPIIDSGEAGLGAGTGDLIGVVSVADIGKIVVPAQSKAILTLPLSEFLKQIKSPAGLTDGVDKYPVYAVGAKSTLLYTVHMLLATNAHRVFVINDSDEMALGRFGVTSIVDVLSRFATLASIEPDPRSMQRHRRASSASLSSTTSESTRSQSSSSIGRNSRPSSMFSSMPGLQSGELRSPGSATTSNPRGQGQSQAQGLQLP